LYILDFNYIDEEDYHNEYSVYNTKTKKEFSNLFEMHYVELKKFNKGLNEIKTAEKKGMEKGMEKGKIEIVTNMLKIGMEIEKN
jgi:hypothetical protein